MISLITIEPLNDVHGALIVDAFNRLFVEGGGEADGWGYGAGYGYAAGYGYGSGDGRGDGGYGFGYGDGTGDGDGYGSPEEWKVYATVSAL